MTGDFQQMSNDETFRPNDSVEASLQKEIDDALGDMSLEQIVEQQEQADQPTADGIRRGTVASVDGDVVLVELGAKEQGLLPTSQFVDEPVPAVGDTVEVTVEGFDKHEGLLKLSREGAIQAASWDSISPGQVVEGVVLGKNKGGLEVKIQGIRAFCPVSMIEMGRVEDLSPYLSQKLQFKVVEVNRADKNVVISRRSLLEEQAAKAKEELLAELEVGQVVEGSVRTLMPYGAFVNIGGVDGLLHVSDMSHGHVDKPSDVVNVGDKLTVKVLKIDKDKERISLGLKQTLADPWQNIESKYPPEQIITGRVTRLADFGAFVELEPGVEGLIPISEMSWARRVGHPKEIVSQGETVKVFVINVDPKRKRISLSLKRVEDDPWLGASVRFPEGSKVEGRVTRVADFGAFVELAKGVEGMIHISELADGFVSSVAEVVQEGQPVEVKILSVDEGKRRIALSIKALTSPSSSGSADRDTIKQYTRESQDADEGAGIFGLDDLNDMNDLAVPDPSQKPGPRRKGKKQKRLKGGLD